MAVIMKSKIRLAECGDLITTCMHITLVSGYSSAKKIELLCDHNRIVKYGVL